MGSAAFPVGTKALCQDERTDRGLFKRQQNQMTNAQARTRRQREVAIF
jgi:hypothetical protein